MIKHNISGLPVVKKSKLVGILTKSDIVNALA
jgi:CBS domain-containing protein